MLSFIGFVIGLLSIGVVLYLAVRPFLPSSLSRTGTIRNVVVAQSEIGSRIAEAGWSGPRTDLLRSVQESRVRRKSDARLTLAKRLKYAQWPIAVWAFHLFELFTAVFLFALVAAKVNIVLQVIALLGGPIVWRWLLSMAVERRFRRFDADYPQFLISVVGLLKTGMEPIAALEAAARGLERSSLVRHEVEHMIDRLRIGVSEDRSIGCFAENVFHPEIELFVQALLLSRRVGGNLSDTLERLAKQMRKRQYFRNSANAAVGMQRGSIAIIIVMLMIVEGVISYMHPQLVIGALQSKLGWQVWQTCLVLILLGIFWVRQVTRIKI